MAYKTILVHAAPEAEAQGRIRLAARLARAMDAHLVGSAPTGVSRYTPDATRALLAVPCAALREAARQALARFERLAHEEGVASVETRLADDEAGAALLLDARYCDLVVVGPGGHDTTPLRPSDLAQFLALAGGRPVLMVPTGGNAALPGVVRWWPGTAAPKPSARSTAPCPCCARRAKRPCCSSWTAPSMATIPARAWPPSCGATGSSPAPRCARPPPIPAPPSSTPRRAKAPTCW
ncbi:universal stress protein [Massilia oculi]|uniref:universal stress protein n=1 Tax=Massilia oculi TaxID=945844 RepID=UPI0013B3CB60|nr:universal stress protein [Massilia oculi]